MRKLLLRALFAAVAASGMTFAVAGGGDPGADPVLGTWELDASKSTFSSGPALKEQTRTYTQDGQKISLVMKSMDADGKQMTARTTYQLDGKDYPVRGNDDWDSLSAKQVDARTAEFVLKKDGKKVGTTTRTVSADGKTLTSKMNTTTTSGEKVTQTLVFHKQ